MAEDLPDVVVVDLDIVPSEVAYGISQRTRAERKCLVVLAENDDSVSRELHSNLQALRYV